MTQPLPDTSFAQRLYTTHYEALFKVYPILPPPLEDTPEGYARRDAAVIEQIAQLVPASAIEAELAAKAVAGFEYWAHCLREAAPVPHDSPLHDRLTAQAARVGRDARGYLASLQRVQTMRTKREATEAGAFRADVIEDNTRSTLQTVLAHPPKAQPVKAQQPALPEAGLPCPAAVPDTDAATPQPAPLPAEPAAPPVPLPHLTAVPRVVASPSPARRRPRTHNDNGWPRPDWAEEAERYAIIYPERARLIRRLGRLPSPCTFGPPEKPLLRAIIAGSSPALCALDGPEEADAGQRLRCA
ncbi:MAG TPA: hypothetical protein VFN42_02275 [Acetobacteraceae bacterium]|nr:hypothetical protein [Acetobacteraceae bacterium]